MWIVTYSNPYTDEVEWAEMVEKPPAWMTPKPRANRIVGFKEGCLVQALKQGAQLWP